MKKIEAGQLEPAARELLRRTVIRMLGRSHGGYRRSLHKQPEQICSYFKHEKIRYAS